MVGMIGISPQSSFVMRATFCISSGSNADGGEAGRCDRMITCTVVSPIAFASSACTCDAVCVGYTRQFTFASASCGSAFVA